MSHVCNVILAMSIIEDEKARINDVNEYFKSTDRPHGFIPRRLPSEVYGGSKSLEARIYIGAFNYLNLGAFVKHLRKVAWNYPDEVQVIYQDQHYNLFRILILKDNLADHGWEERG